MATHFRKIGLIGKYGDPSVGEALKSVIAYLQARELDICVDAGTAEYLPDLAAPVSDRAGLASNCDLVLVVGGDGTLLNAARSLCDADVALVGINLGRLGFLADVSPDAIEQPLDQILNGEFEEDKRSLLHASVIRAGNCVSESAALNDVVIHKWDIARMIELEVHIDGHLLNTSRADGLVVSTPTGSTAYALSGGGPILHPSLAAMVLVPICPHSLNNRPIVIGDAAEIEVTLHAGGYTQAQVTCDGQINFGLLPGDRIQIRRRPHRLRLIHPPGHDYFQLLRAKMHWGMQPK